MFSIHYRTVVVKAIVNELEGSRCKSHAWDRSAAASQPSTIPEGSSNDGLTWTTASCKSPVSALVPGLPTLTQHNHFPAMDC